MPEALTESFCERCGTRYEFKAPTRLNPLRRTRGLVSGLRNYIMSQDALSDAVGDAMRSEEDTLAARQLDAFHASFNFCIDCRQYTCTNCWNDAAGRCRSCAPIAGTDDLLERFEASFQAQHPDLVATNGAALLDTPDGLSDEDLRRHLGVDAWPSSDLPLESNDHDADLSWPSEELVPIAEARALPEPEPEPFVAAEAEPEPELEPELEPEPAAAVAEAEPEPFVLAEAQPHLVLLRWDDDAPFELLPAALSEPDLPAQLGLEPELEAATAVESETERAPEPAISVAEPEPKRIAEPEAAPFTSPAEPEPEPEPVAAVAPDAEPQGVTAVEPEPEPEPEPETQPQPRHLRPIGDTILRLPRPAPALDDGRVAAQSDDPAVAARRAQLDLLGLGDPGQGPLAAQQPNVLPYRSGGASAGAEAVARAAHAAAAGAFWDASAREVAGAMSQVAVQNCGQCGLSLSASARFCRRCGTRQAQPA